MALLFYALTDVATVEKQLGKTLSVDETTVVENMINQATMYAEKHIGRLIKSRETDATETFDIEDLTNLITLKNFPIISITSVTEAEEVLTLADDYLKYDDLGQLRRVNVNWVRGYQVLVVVYKGGYATIPEDLAQWCVNLAVTMFQDKNRGSVKSEKVGDLAVSYGNVGEWITENSFSSNVLDLYKSNFF